MAEYDKTISGYYTSAGTAKTLSLPFQPDWIEVRVQGNSSGDNWESAANPGVAKESYWYAGMSSDSALITLNTAGAATDTKDYVSSNGFKLFQSNPGSFGAPLTASAISQANPAVVSLASTSGLSSGDTVLVTASTGMLQIAGLPFTIASVVANTSCTLAYLNSSGFAAAASAAVVKKILYPNVFLPRQRFITNITQASSAVITFSTTHNYVVGQTIRFHCPSEFGMVEIDGLLGTISAINTSTNTITVNIDSSSFTAFAWPTSAVAAGGVSFPQGIPVGEQASQFDGSFTDNGAQGIILGTSVVGASGALVLWKAGKSLKVYTS
jgi:hypothetical protein